MSKYFIFAGLMFVNLILACVATGRTLDPFDNAYADNFCGKSLMDAFRAFALLTCIFLPFAFILGIVVGAVPVLTLAAPMKLIGAALGGLIVVFSIIPWAIIADKYTSKKFGDSVCILPNTRPDFLAMFVIVTILSIIAVLLLFILPERTPELPPSAEGGASSDSGNVKEDANETNNAADKKQEDSKNAPDAENNNGAPVVVAAAAGGAVVAAAAASSSSEEKKEEPKPKKEKPQIDWKEINSKLPFEKKNQAQKQKRFAMFEEIDEDKDGKVSLPEVTKGMTTVLGLGDKLDVPVVLKTAFDRAAAAGQEQGVNTDEAGANALEKNEFRLFLMYTRMYFEMYHLFSDLDQSGDMAIDAKEFEQALPLLKEWGAQIEDPAATFKQIDKKGTGNVQFKEFVDWALAQNLDCPEDDE